MDNVILQRQIGNILVPPVEMLNDSQAMSQLMTLHVEQKNFLAALTTDEVCHEDVLEYVETYVGTSNMDFYIDNANQQLEQLIISGH